VGRLSRAAAAAGRRDWVQAVWAEAYEVPSGVRRLAWLAGGVRVIAREALMARRIGRWLLFAAAAAVAARVTWPGSPGSFATVIARIDVVTIVLLLAGLPWLARWFLGPAGDSRLARFLRVGGCAAVLTLTVAKARVWRFEGAHGGFSPPHSFAWFVEIVFLVVMAGYVAAILAATGDDTVRTTEFGEDWPDAPHRVLRIATERAAARADEVVGRAAYGDRHWQVVRWSSQPPTVFITGEVAAMAMYAGCGVGDNDDIPSAAQIVDRMTAEALSLLSPSAP